MEAAIIEIGKQIPAVVAIIYLMVKFLSSLEKRDEILNTIRKEWTAGMKDAMDGSRDVISRNADAMEKVHGVISRCSLVSIQSEKKGD